MRKKYYLRDNLWIIYINCVGHRFSVCLYSMNENLNLATNPDNDPKGFGPEHTDDTKIITVVEEQLKVSKKIVETGKVNISKKVTEQETTVEVPHSQDEYDIERISINQTFETPPPPVRYDGDTMIIPVLKEVLVVEKRYVLTEEIRITKRVIQTQETKNIILSKEEINIERTRTDNTEPGI